MEGTIREVQKRDATIELLRFFFCCFIMAHHSYLIGNEGEYPFRAGWRYVEAFFFLSGYFTIRHFAKDDISYKAHEGKAAIIYSIRKIYGVLPMVICCILGNWILIASSTGVGGYQWFKSALPLLPEMLLMYMSGFGTSITVASFWYLSAMLFALPFVIYLCLKKKDLFKFIICPVVSWMVYGYLITTSIGTGAPGMIQWDGFFGGGYVKIGVLRAFAGLCLGCLIYYTSEKMKRYTYPVGLRTLLTVGKYACLLLSTLVALRYYEYSFDLVFILLIFAYFILYFSGQCYSLRVRSKAIGFLGRLSLPMYCCHITVGRVIQQYYGSLPLRDKMIWYYLVSLIVAVPLMIMNDAVVRLFSKRVQR